MTLDALPDPMPTRSTMRRDLISAYFASGAKVASWAIVTGIVVRYGFPGSLSILTLVRSTLGLLAISTLGLAPAMIRLVAEATRVKQNDTPVPTALPTSGVLDYAAPRQPTRTDPASTVYANGLALAGVLLIAGGVLLSIYVSNYDLFHRTSEIPRLYVIQDFVTAMGAGLLIRMFSDAPSARLQINGYIWLDNLLLGSAELLWALFTWMSRDSYSGEWSHWIQGPGVAFFTSGLLLLIARLFVATLVGHGWRYRHATIRWSIIRTLLTFGFLVSIAQLADFLYAPTDYILINRLLSPDLGDVYAPAVQIDSAMLLLVVALANVLLPKSAIAHVRGDIRQVKQYYVRGTLASAGILIAVAIAVLVFRSWIFKLWLGDPMPATQAILPLILIHTVVGGSSAVGRSILLGMGKVKPFTIAVLIAGLCNVILSYSFVRFGGMGLNGIVLGTICAVVGRCAIWQPWYVWKSLNASARVR